MEQTPTEDIDVDSCGPPTRHIPTEVCENIVDMLYSFATQATREHIATLHSCALVCRAWRVRSQRMLFYKVQLSTSTSLHLLSAILDAAQHLRDYVYEVKLTGYQLHNTTSIFALFPAVFAGKLPNLRKVDVVHLRERDESWFPPRTPDPPKSKSFPYIPLHPRFPFFLSTFTSVSLLYLLQATFNSFSEFVRILNGLPNLQGITCDAVHWITPGGAHPGANFMKPPDWEAGECILPPFAPNLRQLEFYNMDMYGVERLMLTRGPHLVWLDLKLPLLSGPEDPMHGQLIDLSSCTRLATLIIRISGQFSMDKHAGFVKELLASWKPQRVQPQLTIRSSYENEFTRRGFADILHGIGTIIETWLHTVTDPSSESDFDSDNNVQYQLYLRIYDWDAEEERWSDHVDTCFPTWLRLRRLSWDFRTPLNDLYTWANEGQSPQPNGLNVMSQVEAHASNSRSESQDTLSPDTLEHTQTIPQDSSL